MNRIKELLVEKKLNKFAFLYGKGMRDIHILGTKKIGNFLEALTQGLFDVGYSRIVHMSPTKVIYCLDEISKVRCADVIWPARQEVLVSGIVPGIETGPFGVQGRIIPDPRFNQDEPGLGDVHGIRLVDHLMREKSDHSTAVVIYDAAIFCQYFRAPRILFGVMNEWTLHDHENRNTCFFCVPVDSPEEFTRNLAVSGLSRFVEHSQGENANVICIESPNTYEIGELIRNHLDSETDSIENKKIIRILAAQGELLTTWKGRFESQNNLSLEKLRSLGWIKNSIDDDRPYSDRLDDYYGLETVKNFVRQISDYVVYHQKRDIPLTKRNLHMIFFGNPGTGKTTVARIFGQIFQENGILKKGHLVEVKASDLIADYVGGSGQKTAKIIDQAMDGILFIDEAYSLSAQDRGGFGQEALEVLLKSMEDQRERFVVILAGYKVEMQNFLKSNPGLDRRFPQANRIEFSDLSEDDLCRILKVFLENENILWNDEIDLIFSEIIHKTKKEKGIYFGNAGEVRNLAEAIAMRVKARCEREGYDDLFVIKEDIPPEYYHLIENPQLSIDQVMLNLDGLTGLKNFRGHLIRLIKKIFLGFTLNGGSKIDREEFLSNYIFIGNPGTGKTTCARILARIYHQLGLFKQDSIVEASASDLIAGYVGQTPQKTTHLFEAAVGGVLLVDEAYTLMSQGRNSANHYGQEAIDTIIKLLDQYKGRMVVIFAGYPAEMMELMRMNPGLRSRFSKIVKFNDFSENELIDIFLKMAENKGYIVNDEVIDEVRRFLFEMKASSPRTFGNARDVKRLFEHMEEQLVQRAIDDTKLPRSVDELPVNWNCFIPQDLDDFDIYSDQQISEDVTVNSDKSAHVINFGNRSMRS